MVKSTQHHRSKTATPRSGGDTPSGRKLSALTKTARSKTSPTPSAAIVTLRAPEKRTKTPLKKIGQQIKTLKVSDAPVKQTAGKRRVAAKTEQHKALQKAAKPAKAAARKTSKPALATASPAKIKPVSPPASPPVPKSKEIAAVSAPSAMQPPRLSATPKALLFPVTTGQRNGHASLAAASPPLKTGKAMGKTYNSDHATIELPADYRPSDKEPFMNARQRVYFRTKLSLLKDDIIKQNRETLQTLHEDTSQHSDLADRATSETDRALELRTRDRQRKLVGKIDAAIARIDDGTYGYCEETGEPISLRRLDARPIATLSLEAQERHERREKVYRDD